MPSKIKVSGGFISKEEPNPYEHRTPEGYIIPGEFEDRVKEQEHEGPRTPEGYIIPAEFIDHRKSPEEKQYLIFYTAIDDDGTYQTWEVCTGRTEAYRFVKTMVNCIDFTNSFVLVEGVSLEDAVTLYDFTKHIKQYYDDSFDIDDYIDTDMSQENESEDNSTPDEQLMNMVVGKDTRNKNTNTEAIELYKASMASNLINVAGMSQNLMSTRDEKEDSKNI